jgi:hypothetical protein
MWSAMEEEVTEYVKHHQIYEDYLDKIPAPGGPPIEGLDGESGFTCSDCDLSYPSEETLKNHWPGVHHRSYNGDCNNHQCHIQALYLQTSQRHYFPVNRFATTAITTAEQCAAEYYHTYDSAFQAVHNLPARPLSGKNRPPIMRVLACDDLIKDEMLASRQWVNEVYLLTHPPTKSSCLSRNLSMICYTFLEYTATLMGSAPPGLSALIAKDEK